MTDAEMDSDPLYHVIRESREAGEEPLVALIKCQMVLSGNSGPHNIEMAELWQEQHGPPTWENLLAWAVTMRSAAVAAVRRLRAGGFRTQFDTAEKMETLILALALIADGHVRGDTNREKLRDCQKIARRALDLVEADKTDEQDKFRR